MTASITVRMMPPVSTFFAAVSSPPATARSAGNSIPCSTPFIASHSTSANQNHVWLNSMTPSDMPCIAKPNRPVRINAGA